MSRINSPHHHRAIHSIPVSDEVARSLIPGECLGYLTRDPFGCRVRCDVDPDQVSAIQADDYEGVEQVEANGRRPTKSGMAEQRTNPIVTAFKTDGNHRCNRIRNNSATAQSTRSRQNYGFFVAAPDVITDFDDFSNDRIDVSALFGPAMAYRHNLAFTAAGQVRINDIAGADVLVEVNTGGTLAPDAQIRLTNTTLASMTASDFIL